MSFKFNTVPFEQRCYQSNSGQFCNWPTGDCFFGVPIDELYGRSPLTTIPDDATGFHFYLGADQQALFDSFVDSDLPELTTSLHIGDSSYCLGNGRDYSQLTASLAKGDFPNLETLELGVWQLFGNSHCAYGNVGCIDRLSEEMPKLRRLYIYGRFDLHIPLSFPKLEIVHLVVDDPATGINGGELDSSTFSNLLSSSFPKLRELHIDLKTDDGGVCYFIPDAILTDDVLPNLTDFSVVGTFRRGDKQLLMDSPILRNKNIKIHLDEMLDGTELE